MKWEKLGLGHQSLLEPKLKSLQSDVSDYSFANLYLFRKKHQFEISYPFIRGVTYDGHRYIMPLENQGLFDVLKDAEFLFPIADKDLSLYPEFQKEFKESECDYVFRTEKLRLYPGRKLQKKRNLVHQFKENYSAVVCPLTKDLEKDALDILEKWKKEEESDYLPCLEAIKKLDILHLEGLIFYVENKPIAFLLGEILNPSMFVIHFAKADIAYKGVYQYIYQTFAEQLRAIEFINMEQDLDIPSLSQAKHSYQPDRLIKKWRLTPIEYRV